MQKQQLHKTKCIKNLLKITPFITFILILSDYFITFFLISKKELLKFHLYTVCTE